MVENNPFSIRELKKSGIINKIFGIKPAENAIIEINNLFASVEKPSFISAERLDEIAYKYKIKNILKQFRNDFENIYESYLKYCLQDKKLTDTEFSELHHLKQLFLLNDTSIETIHNRLCSEIYGQSVRESITDGRLTTEEKDFLDKIENELRLPENIAKEIYTKKAEEYLQNYIKNTVSDQRLSPSEENEIKAISESLMMSIVYNDKTKAALAKYRLFWMIENGNIPEIETDVKLQRGERAYAQVSAELYEKKMVTRRIRYHGPTARIRIWKGFYYRMGDIAVHRVTEDITQKQDVGELILTNKRLIFMGNQKNMVIRLTKILGLTPYSDGVEIEKETGRNPIFLFNNNVDIFVFTLSKAIDEATQ